MKTTGELTDGLKNTRSIDYYLEKNENNFTTKPVSEYLEELLCDEELKKRFEKQNKVFKKSNVISDSGINEIYAYQIFQGTKKPTRDKLLLIAKGFGLNYDEVQKMLKTCAYPQLYSKDRRDSVISYGFMHGISVTEINLKLDEIGELPLV